MKKKLTKSEKRVLVAKDALKQIRAEKYMPTMEILFDSPPLTSLDRRILISSPESQLQPLLKDQPPCEVCARGALLLSTVRKFNDYTTHELVFHKDENIRDLFGSDRIDQIEAAFECWRWTSGVPHTNSAKACRFGEGYSDPTERLVAILKNIIKNNGKFKP